MAGGYTTAALSTKVTEAEKKCFIDVCDSIGTTPSNAIRMFVSAFNKHGGFPFNPANPDGFNAETLVAMDDAISNRNLYGPYATVEEMITSLDEG